MAPGTRRAGRSGYAEHDDFEGLPVRQWRHDWVNVAPPQPQEPLQQNDIWAVELLHGMPKDSALLAPHSQELLRVARSGRLYKRPAPAEEEEVEAEVAQPPEKSEKREEEPAIQGFSIKLWKQIPRNIEGSGLSHLAKRRKGTVTIASKTIEEKTTVPTVTRATVRRIDAAGNPYTEEVTLAEGHQVVGEIISTRIEVAPAAAAEGFVAPTPPVRRRPPPPKRKSKAGGPGRGKRRGKVPLPGEGSAAGTISAADDRPGPGRIEGQGENGTLHDDNGTPNVDSEMADGDEDDDDDVGDEGEDGDDDDQDEGDQRGDADESRVQDMEMGEAQDDGGPPIASEPLEDAMEGIETKTVSPPNPLTLAPPAASLANHTPMAEGSPLKNVVLQSPPDLREPPAVPAIATEIPSGPAAAPLPLGSLAPIAGEATELELPQTESLIAEPPSTVAGDEGDASPGGNLPKVETAAEESQSNEDRTAQTQAEVQAESLSPKLMSDDTPSRESALLPPPPEQVGNISSPKSYDGPDRNSDIDDRMREDHLSHSAAMPERPPLNPMDSIMTEDTIKPEDSASVRFPLTESDAPSGVGTTFAEEPKDSAEASLEPPEDLPAESQAESAQQSTSGTAESLVAAVEPTKTSVPEAPKQDTHPELSEQPEEAVLPNSPQPDLSTEMAEPASASVSHTLKTPAVSPPRKVPVSGEDMPSPQNVSAEETAPVPREHAEDAAAGAAGDEQHQIPRLGKEGEDVENEATQRDSTMAESSNEEAKRTLANNDSEPTFLLEDQPTVEPKDQAEDKTLEPSLPQSPPPLEPPPPAQLVHAEQPAQPVFLEGLLSEAPDNSLTANPAAEMPQPEELSAMPQPAELPPIIEPVEPANDSSTVTLPPILPSISDVTVQLQIAEGEDATDGAEKTNGANGAEGTQEAHRAQEVDGAERAQGAGEEKIDPPVKT